MMLQQKTTFALFFGNRGMFPGSLMAAAREEVPRILKEMGHDSIMLDSTSTRYGAVETPQEGEIYANFLRENRGKFGGVIVLLPNFGDENGARVALKEAGVPIFIQAYPDDLDKMAPAVRRDAFCGKCSITDVFYQSAIKFTVLKPHTVHPTSATFKEQIAYFDKVCRVYGGIKGMSIGMIGARVTPFKTVRIDEVALQRHDITVEVFDLSDMFHRVASVAKDARYADKKKTLEVFSTWKGVPEEAFDKLIRSSIVFDQYVEECKLDALAIRCWNEFESVLGISPCVLLGELNERRITAACEVDIGNAVAMHALSLASYQPAACLDWNNNYADDEDKCILFHCGPVPASLMAEKGRITSHAILSNIVGESCTYGCNVGRMAPGAFTFASMMTWDGHPRFYLGNGAFTTDPIPEDFFGCAGVAHIERLQDVMLHVTEQGFRHHVSVTPGEVAAPMREALTKYMGLEVVLPQNN